MQLLDKIVQEVRPFRNERMMLPATIYMNWE